MSIVILCVYMNYIMHTHPTKVNFATLLVRA